MRVAEDDSDLQQKRQLFFNLSGIRIAFKDMWEEEEGEEEEGEEEEEEAEEEEEEEKQQSDMVNLTGVSCELKAIACKQNV
jgi:hypothetical protein